MNKFCQTESALAADLLGKNLAAGSPGHVIVAGCIFRRLRGITLQLAGVNELFCEQVLLAEAYCCPENSGDDEKDANSLHGGSGFIMRGPWRYSQRMGFDFTESLLTVAVPYKSHGPKGRGKTGKVRQRLS